MNDIDDLQMRMLDVERGLDELRDKCKSPTDLRIERLEEQILQLSKDRDYWYEKCNILLTKEGG
jgi:hypothetical protein